LLDLHQSPETFGQMICDQFDVLYEDGAQTGRVMAICLHPFLVGYPHRSKYFAKALHHITSRQEVWLATGGALVGAYKGEYLYAGGESGRLDAKRDDPAWLWTRALQAISARARCSKCSGSSSCSASARSEVRSRTLAIFARSLSSAAAG